MSGLSRARRIGGGRIVVPPAPATRAEPAAAPEGAPPSRAGRNLPAAIGVGLALGVVIIATLFLYRPSFAILVGMAVAYGSYELSRAIGTAGAHVALVPVVVGGLASLAAAWARGPDGLVIGIILSGCGVLIWRIGDGADGFLRDVGRVVPRAALRAGAGRLRRAVRARRTTARRASSPSPSPWCAATPAATRAACCSAGIRSRRSCPRRRPGKGFFGSLLFCAAPACCS